MQFFGVRLINDWPRNSVCVCVCVEDDGLFWIGCKSQREYSFLAYSLFKSEDGLHFGDGEGIEMCMTLCWRQSYPLLHLTRTILDPQAQMYHLVLHQHLPNDNEPQVDVEWFAGDSFVLAGLHS